MSDEQWLLVIREERREKGRISRDVDRRRVLTALQEAGVRLRHDSGGRLLIVEASEKARASLERGLKNIKILPLEEDVDERLGEMDPQDSLFARALRIRLSPEYREMKRRQKPGETPEEKLLVTGSCTPPED